MDRAVTAQQDQEIRFNRMFEANYDLILRFCLRRVPLADANDAASDVFVVAWRRIADAPSGDEARLWLYGIARNVVRNSQRSARRSLRLTTKLSGLAKNDVESPEPQVVANDELRRVLVVLGTFSEKEQEVLRLRAMERLSLAEMAAVLGCSEDAARKRFERAAKRLNKQVSSPALAQPIIPCESEGEVTT